MDELASTIVLASESSFWGCPDYILKPMKSLNFKPSQAQKGKKCFWSSEIRFLKSCLKCMWGVKMSSKSLFKGSRLLWNRFPTYRMNLEWFYEKWKFWLFQFFWLVFKHILCINPSENENDFDFLNFFTKMKPLIKNLKRWSF